MCRLLFVAMISMVLGMSGFSHFSMGRPDESKPASAEDIDARVRRFLSSSTGRSWYGMSVPDADGQALYDIVVQHGYKDALEIGTSVGRSAIWIGWALSKTGGKLITVEIDPDAHAQALANFRETGLSPYIDARLGDAHKIVPELKGPYDFVFCDADKEWYSNYLDAVLPKLKVGGCFAAHNVSESRFGMGGGRWRGGFGRGFSGDFLEHARSFPFLDTKVLNIPGSAGMSVSFKRAEK